MLERSVLISAKKYLAALKETGVDVELVVVFGSQATGRAHKWSDIDLLVVAPQFDVLHDRSSNNLLWRLAARIDSRISRQWREDDSSAIVEIARRQGEVLKAA